jgi:hypothetical protein
MQQILAIENSRRYIGQRENGVVQLVWDNLSLKFQPTELVELVGILKQTWARQLESRQSDVAIFTFQAVRLLLHLEEFTILYGLAWLASCNLTAAEERIAL